MNFELISDHKSSFTFTITSEEQKVQNRSSSEDRNYSTEENLPLQPKTGRTKRILMILVSVPIRRAGLVAGAAAGQQLLPQHHHDRENQEALNSTR